MDATSSNRLTEIGNEIRGLTRNTGESVVRLGNYLIEAKELCQHGEWETWLTQYFVFSMRTAQRFIAIATELSDLPNLNLYKPTALSLLVSSSTPPEVKESMIQLGSSGEPVTPKVVKEAIASFQDESDMMAGSGEENDRMADFTLESQSDRMTGLLRKSDIVADLLREDDRMAGFRKERDPNTFMPDCELPETRHLTAMTRGELSTPVRLAMEKGYIKPGCTHLDYGCGKAGDVVRLRMKGVESYGWDPFFFPQHPLLKSDIVTLNYVLNVIENPDERVEVLRKAYSHATKALIVAVRVDPPPAKVLVWGDGHITSKGTFQKHYSQQEASDFISSVLGVEAIIIASGVFVVPV